MHDAVVECPKAALPDAGSDVRDIGLERMGHIVASDSIREFFFSFS